MSSGKAGTATTPAPAGSPSATVNDCPAPYTTARGPPGNTLAGIRWGCRHIRALSAVTAKGM
ncbi:hypothetical protein GCM10010376_73620 [Streptomyces violaceusniger]